MRGLILAAGALALAACAGGELAGFGPAVRGGGGSLPATRAEAREDVVTPPGRRNLGLAVRAFAVENGQTVELAGATCRVTGAAFEVVVATPARVVIPDLGPDAPALRADCAAGTLRGAATVAPVFAWAAGGGNPPQRVAWGLGWTYGFAKVGPMRYPDIAVTLVESARQG